MVYCSTKKIEMPVGIVKNCVFGRNSSICSEEFPLDMPRACPVIVKVNSWQLLKSRSLSNFDSAFELSVIATILENCLLFYYRWFETSLQ